MAMSSRAILCWSLLGSSISNISTDGDHAVYSKDDVSIQTAATLAGVEAAYYSIVRQVIFDFVLRDEAFATIVHRLSGGPELYHDIIEALASATAISEFPFQHHAVQQLAESQTGPWSVMQGVLMVSVSVTGTRPGDTFADVILGIIFQAY